MFMILHYIRYEVPGDFIPVCLVGVYSLHYIRYELPGDFICLVGVYSVYDPSLYKI